MVKKFNFIIHNNVIMYLFSCECLDSSNNAPNDNQHNHDYKTSYD